MTVIPGQQGRPDWFSALNPSWLNPWCCGKGSQWACGTGDRIQGLINELPVPTILPLILEVNHLITSSVTMRQKFQVYKTAV